MIPPSPSERPDPTIKPEPQPEPSLTSEEERKLSIARGEGMRQDRSRVPITESGERVLFQDGGSKMPLPCRVCGVNPCWGVQYIMDGNVNFRCESCGKGMRLGLTERAAAENKVNLEGWDRAEMNWKRVQREKAAMRTEEHERQYEQFNLPRVFE